MEEINGKIVRIFSEDNPEYILIHPTGKHELPEFVIYYHKVLEFEKQRTSNMDEAKRMATTVLYQLNEKLSDRHKLFSVKKL